MKECDHLTNSEESKVGYSIHPLAIDTEILGINTAKIQIDLSVVDHTKLANSLIKSLNGSEVEYATVRLPISNDEMVNELKQHGFVEVENYLIKIAKIEDLSGKIPKYINGIVVKTATNGDIDELQKTVAPTFTHSRFFKDSHYFTEGAPVRMYEEWIKNSITSGLADFVFVAKLKNQAVGILTAEMDKEGLGHIPLVGVHDKHRRKGVASGLTRVAAHWFKSQGATRVRIETQADNEAADLAYKKAGFNTVDTMVTLRWAKENRN